MYTFAFSMKDEDDEDYEPKVEVRRIVTNIPKFPDISAFGPKSIGALKLLNDWIDDDVGEWLVTHEKEEFLDEDSGMPISAVDHDMLCTKALREHLYVFAEGAWRSLCEIAEMSLWPEAIWKGFPPQSIRFATTLSPSP